MAIQKSGYPASGWFGSGLVKPVKLDLQFTVTPTNGLGVTSVKSNGYARNVFMHTSTTPASNNGYLNPNPANGFVAVQLNNTFNTYIGCSQSAQSPLSGTPVLVTAGLTVGALYTITVVGTTTNAQWAVLGVPPGVTPAVGVSFVAITATASTGTGAVQLSVASGIDGFEAIGNSSLSSMNASIGTNGGAWFYGAFLSSTSGTNTALIATAPAAGTIVSLSLYYDASSVTIDGL